LIPAARIAKIIPLLVAELRLIASTRRVRLIRGLNKLVRRNCGDESLVATVVGHFQILALMSHPFLRPILLKDPYAHFRPFKTYLAPGFTRQQRREAFREHYAYLTTCLRESFFSGTVLGAPVLWESARGLGRVAITISRSDVEHEGELQLEFQGNGQALFHVSMSIAPGRLVGSTATRAIVIARVQGVRGKWEEIRNATKMCSEVSPPFLLMSAVQAIARATDITCIAGIRNAQKGQMPGEQNPEMRFDYDQFWQKLLATVGSEFCLLPVPMIMRPMAEISVNHRKRTLIKRQLKQAVEDTVYDRFLTEFCQPCSGRSGQSPSSSRMSE